jgi:hypothetical protein
MAVRIHDAIFICLNTNTGIDRKSRNVVDDSTLTHVLLEASDLEVARMMPQIRFNSSHGQG